MYHILQDFAYERILFVTLWLISTELSQTYFINLSQVSSKLN